MILSDKPYSLLILLLKFQIISIAFFLGYDFFLFLQIVAFILPIYFIKKDINYTYHADIKGLEEFLLNPEKSSK